MSVESRLKKIEDAIGTQITARSPEEMARAFIQGEYGPPADLFRLLLAGERSAAEEFYPLELIEVFESHRESRKSEI